MSEKEAKANDLSGRLKILYLYKILWEKTDDEHALTMSELLDEMSGYGIKVGRKAIYDYVGALREFGSRCKFGVEINEPQGKNAAYRITGRTFDPTELRLLADAVASSSFFTEKTANELMEKLETLCSEHEAGTIRRHVYIANRPTTENKYNFFNVNEIHLAIANKKKISFKYVKYDLKKEKKDNNEERVCSPYALTWNDEKYYLIAYYEKYKEITHFRVDRMESVQILDEPAHKMPGGFNLSDHMVSTFSMFSGKEETVRLRFKNTLINAVIDRFGKQISPILDGEEHFTVRVPIRTSSPAPFFAWLFQFGEDAQIISPDKLRKKYIGMLNNTAAANASKAK